MSRRTKELTHGSLFAGIGGFDLGFERAGLQTIWQVENDPYCLKVLERHWPDVQRYGDVERIERLEDCDILTAGFPCQDLSVAGKRKGLAGARSRLFWEIIRIARKVLPRWILIENVPGLFSSDDGRDFGIVLTELGKLGYGVAGRVFNSQYLGVPQRRRRVFIVGYFGAVCPGEILFESEGGVGVFKAGGEEGSGVARTLTGGVAGGRSHGKRSGDDRQTLVAYNIQQNDGGEHRRKDRPEGGMYVKETDTALAVGSTDRAVVGTLPARERGGGGFGTEFESDGGLVVAHALRAEGADAREDGMGRGTPLVAALVMARDRKGPLPDRALGTVIATKVGVRRLTPRECERLQGFPDDWTRWDAEGNEISDSARYRMLGNAVTVNVAQWLAKRILEFEKSRVY